MDRTKRYYKEETLIEMYQQGEIDLLFFVTHHDPVMLDEYTDWCKARGLKQTPDTASDYLDWRDEQFEEALANVPQD